MDRRSFLKGTAAAAAVAPALPAIAAAPPSLVTGTITGAELASGSITAAKIDLANAFVIYEHGMCQFDAGGFPRVLMGTWEDKPRPTPKSVPEMGAMQMIVRRTEGAEIQNYFEVIE